MEVVQTENEGIAISVRDQGVGLPEDFDLKPGERLCMRRGNALSTQVQAKLQVRRLSPRTEVRFTLLGAI